MEAKKCIAYIPARGGSKRIPQKNIKPLDGKPIILHVIELIEQLDFVDAICVSTDDDGIIKLLEEESVLTLGKRAPELSNDYCGFRELLLKDIVRFEKYLDLKQDYHVLMILPTAALLTEQDLCLSYNKFLTTDKRFLFAAKTFEISAYWAFSEDDTGKVIPLFPTLLNERSQDLKETFSDAGLYYFLDSSYIKEPNHTWFHGENIGYSIVDPLKAIDVDTENDWKVLERHYALSK
tara:strand:- start:240 stop:947 length:708 start_codon:yes stop_codon:yes gene_type:complete